jgi:hypothetical protein
VPLLDHFRSPLYPLRRWESFHAQWAASIANQLNSNALPPDYFAEVQVHVGSRVEIDIATMEGPVGERPVAGGAGSVATLPSRTWAPPAATFAMPAIYPDSLEVLIYSTEGGATVVAAVELVSPGNKDRHEYRQAFAAKCLTYLQQGIGLVIVDVVTTRRANLHNELVDLLGIGQQYYMSPEPLYAVSYRPIRRDTDERTDVWPISLSLGAPLPLLPLGLDKAVCVPLDLEPAYAEACQRSKLPLSGAST